LSLFAFLPDQTEESYKWALSQNKELYKSLNSTIFSGSEAIATDCDQALRYTLSSDIP
jgi:hypothetical protein